MSMLHNSGDGCCLFARAKLPTNWQCPDPIIKHWTVSSVAISLTERVKRLFSSLDVVLVRDFFKMDRKAQAKISNFFIWTDMKK